MIFTQFECNVSCLINIFICLEICNMRLSVDLVVQTPWLFSMRCNPIELEIKLYNQLECGPLFLVVAVAFMTHLTEMLCKFRSKNTSVIVTHFTMNSGTK